MSLFCRELYVFQAFVKRLYVDLGVKRAWNRLIVCECVGMVVRATGAAMTSPSTQ